MTDDVRIGLDFPAVQRSDQVWVDTSPTQDWLVSVGEQGIELTGQLRKDNAGRYLLFSADAAHIVFENSHVVAWALVTG